MVLEETSDSRDVFASDDAPPTDRDESNKAVRIEKSSIVGTQIATQISTQVTPEEIHLDYRVNGGPQRHYKIRFDRMPLQGLSRAAAFGSRWHTVVTSQSIASLMSKMEVMCGRPLTQLEAEGLALHVSRRGIYSFAGTWATIIVGGLAAYRTRKAFKFPFRKPKAVENYSSFPLQRVPVFTGAYARTAWHLTRGATYSFLTALCLAPFLGSVAASAQAVHTMRDPRTSALAQECSKSLRRARQETQEDMKREARRTIRGISDGKDVDQSSTASNSPDSDSSGYGDFYGGSQGDYVQDDNSPTSSQYPYSDTTSNTGVLSDSQMQWRTRAQRHSQASSDPSNRNTFDLEKVSRQPRTFDSEYKPPTDSSSPSNSSSSSFFEEEEDDASLTAGKGPYPSTTTSSSPPGSAWARIRQSANSSDPTSSPPSSGPRNRRGILPPNTQTRQSPSARQLQQQSTSARDEYEYESSADSFSFSKDAEERQLAKEQAQREFDRMIEAERKGEGAGISGVGAGGSGGGENYWGRKERRTVERVGVSHNSRA